MPLCGGFLASRVVGLGVAEQLPWLAAASSDRSVRVWNYETRTCIAAKHMTVRTPFSSRHAVVGRADEELHGGTLLTVLPLACTLLNPTTGPPAIAAQAGRQTWMPAYAQCQRLPHEVASVAYVSQW